MANESDIPPNCRVAVPSSPVPAPRIAQASELIRFGSFCSGIGAPELAWSRLGWVPQFFSEIEPFPCAVLAHYYPTIPNLGDMEKIDAETLRRFPVDVVVAGTPCQSFSVAGLRKGLDDPRGNLALVLLRLLDIARPQWVVWENVPGVLSSFSADAPNPPPPPLDMERDGQEVDTEDDREELHAFNCFLAGLSELGYGFAYRILDAQFAGIPQRRRRVFVVGYLGDWRRAAAVLFERHSLSGNPSPSREAKSRVAASLTRGADSNGKGGYAGRRREDDLNLVANCIDTMGGAPDDNAAQGNHLVAVGIPDTCPAIKARDYKGPSSDGDGDGAILVPMIAHSLRAESFDASEDGTGWGTPLVAIAIQERAVSENPENGPQGKGWQEEHAFTMEARHHVQAVATPMARRESESAHPAYAVRRLTPLEAERLQGFPDDFTLIPFRGKPAADGPRYQALGNSMAVPVLRWIGMRIQSLLASAGHVYPTCDASEGRGGGA